MDQRPLSRTALGAAHLRAMHQAMDAAPHILEDPVAARLLGPELMAKLAKNPEELRQPESRFLRAHVVLRSRFAEDRLKEAVRRGVSQYVILGAGLDTFALRQPEWAAGLQIFEIDQPASQEFKRQRLAAAGLDLPANLHLVAIDFEREPLAQGLARGGVVPNRPTFFSWLGVTMYLSQEAIAAVLRTVAAYPAGSEMVLTFSQPPLPPGQDPGEGRAALTQRVAEVGEPFVSHFTPREIAALLRDCGFRQPEFLTPEQSAARYFAQRPSDLLAPRRTAIVAARV